MQVEKLQNLVEKLRERKNTTQKAVNSLVSLIIDLEKSLSEDISTDITKSSIKLKIDRKAKNKSIEADFEWQLSDNKFSLFIKNGKIKIYNLYNCNDYSDENLNKYYYFLKDVNLSDLINEEFDVIRIDFKMLTASLEELMLKAVEKANYIDEDINSFIKFYNNWTNK